MVAKIIANICFLCATKLEGNRYDKCFCFSLTQFTGSLRESEPSELKKILQQSSLSCFAWCERKLRLIALVCVRLHMRTFASTAIKHAMLWKIEDTLFCTDRVMNSTAQLLFFLRRFVLTSPTKEHYQNCKKCLVNKLDFNNSNYGNTTYY